MQIDWWTLLLQTVNFLIVVWLLTRFLYHPIKRVIEAREAEDRKAEEAADQKVRAAEESRKAYEAKRAALADARREEEARLHAEMEAERQAMLEAAGKKADDLVAEARARIERERKQALDDLGDQIAGLAAELARRALGERALAGEGLLEQVTSHLDALPEEDLSDLRADLAGNGNALTAVFAAELPQADQARWREELASRFDGTGVEFQADPALLGGAELRFPHAVLSFSVADRLKRAAQEMKAG